MKAVLSVIFVMTFSGLADAQTIFERTFSDAAQPGFRRTGSGAGASEYFDSWSLTRSLQMEGENQFAHYDLSVSSPPPNESTRSYGGFFENIGSFTTLPGEWQLSFQIKVDVAEPFRVQFYLRPSYIPSEAVTLTAWASPSTLGWNTVTLDQNSFTTVYGIPIGGPAPDGTYLAILMASHDASSNPLSLATVGIHSFSVDNISMTAVPEPHTVGLLVAASSLAFCLSKRARLKSAPNAEE